MMNHGPSKQEPHARQRRRGAALSGLCAFALVLATTSISAAQDAPQECSENSDCSTDCCYGNLCIPVGTFNGQPDRVDCGVNNTPPASNSGGCALASAPGEASLLVAALGVAIGALVRRKASRTRARGTG